MGSLPSRSQSPGAGATASPSHVSMRTSQGSAYGSPVLSEPKPLASLFPGTSMPPSSPPSPLAASGAPGLGGVVGGRLGSTLSLVEGRGLAGSPPARASGMAAVPQHYGATLPRQSQPLAYGADPYGLYQRSALPRPDSLIGQSPPRLPPLAGRLPPLLSVRRRVISSLWSCDAMCDTHTVSHSHTQIHT